MLNLIKRNIWLYNSTFQQRYICTYRQDMVEYGSRLDHNMLSNVEIC